MISRALYGLVIVLNFTELFRFVSLFTDTTMQTVGAVLLGVNCVLLVGDYRLTVNALKCWPVCATMLLVIVWPSLTMIFAPFLDLRQAGLQSYYATLVILVIVAIEKHGLGFFGKLAGL